MSNQKKISTKLIIVVCIAFISIAAVATAVIVMLNSKKIDIYTTLLKTQKAYAQETELLITKNPVLNSLKTNLLKSYTQQLKLPEASISLSDDKEARVLSADIKSDYIPVTGKLFLTDTRLIAGVPLITYLEADPKSLGSDLAKFTTDMGQIGSIEYIDELTDILDMYDFSYSNITGMYTAEPNFVYRDIVDRYTDVIKILLDKAEFKKDKSSVLIGESFVKTDRISVTFDSQTISGWLQNDLFPTLKNDTDIRDIYSKFSGVYGYGLSYQSYDECIDTLYNDLKTDIIDSNTVLSINADVYNDVIVAIELLVANDNLDEKAGIALSALGEKYMLNNIRVDLYDGYSAEPSFITMSGDHIGEAVFTTSILANDNMTKRAMSVNWHTEGTSDNLLITADDESYVMTFALDDKDVVAENDDISWRLEQFSGDTELPEKTTLIRDTTVADLINELSPLLSMLY